MKDKIIGEEGARSFLDHIEDCLRRSIRPVNSKIITRGDKLKLQWALARLRPSFDELAKWFIDPMRETRPSDAVYGYDKLWELMAAAFLAGGRGTVAVNGKKYWRHVQAQKMRDARRATPKEVALRTAIVAESRPGRIERTWKEANAIRGAVNKRLTLNGFDPVNTDKIRRRLPLRS